MTEIKTITRAEWVAALRSGKYAQSKGILCGDSGYCCLGVAATVAGYTREDIRRLELDEDLLSGNSVSVDPEEASVEELKPLWKIAENLGLDLELEADLARMNDAGIPFSEIADYIERLS